jgi:hypothetical protein
MKYTEDSRTCYRVLHPVGNVAWPAPLVLM